MAGYVRTDEFSWDPQEFHIDTENVVKKIHTANNKKRVLTVQLDGDELDAFYFGMAQYRKGCHQATVCACGAVRLHEQRKHS